MTDRLRQSLHRFLAFFRRAPLDRDLDAEMKAHLEFAIEDNLRHGLAPAEARRQALLRFGGLHQAKEQHRESRGLPFLEALLQDLRYSMRMLRKSPGFTAIAVLTLALGIGANTAIFTLLDAIIFRALPVHDPQQLVLLQWHAHKSPNYDEYSSFGDCAGGNGGDNPRGCSFSSPMYDVIRAHATVFDGMLAFAGPAKLTLTGNGPASRVGGEIVSGDYFQTLGVHAALGRTIEPSDDAPSASPVVVLGYGYWQSAFGGSPSVIGHTINLNAVPFTVVGVVESKFTGLSSGKTHEMWLTRSVFPRVGFSSGWSRIEDPGNAWLVIMARLKSEIPRAQAQAAVSLLFRDELSHGSKPLLEAKYEPSVVLLPARDGLTHGTEIMRPLYVLMLAVAIILMISCANVAGLQLARSGTRRREMAVRLALGAPRLRIARQLLTESVLLSVLGGILGVFFAYWGARAITALLSGGSSGGFPFPLSPNLRILAFTSGVSILSGVLFGLAPALRTTRVELTPALKESAAHRQSRALGGHWLNMGNALVAAQIALAVVVLAGAGLLVRTLNSLQSVNPGFDTRSVLLFSVDPALLNYKTDQIQTLYGELQTRLSALPGVISVGYSANALLTGDLSSGTISIQGLPDKTNVEADSLATGPGFFETMRIPLRMGRLLNAPDFTEAPATPGSLPEPASGPSASPAPAIVPVLVNETFVRRYCRELNPLGMRVLRGDSEHSSGDLTQGKPRSRIREIVGVVADAKYDALRRDIQPTIYGPLRGGGAHFELRTATEPSLIIPAVRKIVAQVDGNLPISDMSTETEKIYQQLSQERFIARLSSSFALLALLLACIGVYGLLSYDVAQRTQEIGIRMALGAERLRVLRLVMGQGIAVAVAGATIGAFVAIGVTRYLRSFLYGVLPGDPVTLIAVSALLLLVVFAACLVPARRATVVDPMVALRYE
jgi:predicted permease